MKTKTSQGRLLTWIVMLLLVVSATLFVWADLGDRNGAPTWGIPPVPHGVGDYARDIGLAALLSGFLYLILWPPSFDFALNRSRIRLQIAIAFALLGLMPGIYFILFVMCDPGFCIALPLASLCCFSLALLLLAIAATVFFRRRPDTPT